MAELDTLQTLRRGFAARGDLAALFAVTAEGEETWSFAKLGEASAGFAAGLAARGIGRGDGVGLIAPNSPLWIAAFWGIIAAGAVAVPLDAQNEDRELASMIETAGCRLLFTGAANAERLRALAPACPMVILDRASDSAAAANANLPAVAAADIALVVFTSGTTGTPKAVPLSHDNVLTNVRALAPLRLVGPGDRALLPLPLYHAYPVIIGMITPLALGCGVVLPAGVSGPELLAAMRRGRVTALVGVPRLYTALLDNVRHGIAARSRPMALLARGLLAFAQWSFRHGANWPGRILLRPMRRQVAPHLRLLVSGGAAVELEVEETLDAMGWELLTGYGLVETSSMLSFNPPGGSLPGSAGRPVPGMAVRIANPDADGVGEIEARGPSLFAGYRDDPAKTQEAFTPDGWFRTGDLGSVDGRGYIHIAARKTETIVLADGKKLFPEAFEAVYATAPLIREIALLGVNGALVGLVVPDLAAARELGAERLGGALRDRLGGEGQCVAESCQAFGLCDRACRPAAHAARQDPPTFAAGALRGGATASSAGRRGRAFRRRSGVARNSVGCRGPALACAAVSGSEPRARHHPATRSWDRLPWLGGAYLGAGTRSRHRAAGAGDRADRDIARSAARSDDRSAVARRRPRPP